MNARWATIVAFLFVGTAASARSIIQVCADARQRFVPDATETARTRVVEAQGDYGLDYPGAVYALAISSDGNRVAVGGAARVLRVWDRRRSKVVADLRHDREVTAAALSADGTVAVAGLGLSGNGGFPVVIWDVETGRELRRLGGHDWDVRSIRILGNQVLVADKEGRFDLSDLASGKLLQSWSVEGDPAAAEFSPAGERVLGVMRDGRLFVWDAQDGRLLSTAAVDAGLRAASWLDPRRAVLATASGFFEWDVNGGARGVTRAPGFGADGGLENAPPSPAAVIGVAGATVVLAGFRGSPVFDGFQRPPQRLAVLDARTGRARAVADASSAWTRAAISGDGRTIVVGGVGRVDITDAAAGVGRVELIDAASGVEQGTTSLPPAPPPPQPAVVEALTPDRSRILRGPERAAANRYEPRFALLAAGERKIAQFSASLAGFLPDPTRFYAWVPGGRLEIRRTSDGELISARPIAGVPSWFPSIDGEMLFAERDLGARGHFLVVVSLQTGDELTSHALPAGADLLRVVHGGRWALLRTKDSMLVFELATGGVRATFSDKTSRPPVLLYTVLLAGDPPRAFVSWKAAEPGLHYGFTGWDLESGRALRRFSGHLCPVHGVLALEGGLLLSYSTDGDGIRIWSEATGQQVDELSYSAHRDAPSRVVVEPGGTRFRVDTRRGRHLLYEVLPARRRSAH